MVIFNINYIMYSTVNLNKRNTVTLFLNKTLHVNGYFLLLTKTGNRPLKHFRLKHKIITDCMTVTAYANIKISISFVSSFTSSSIPLKLK